MAEYISREAAVDALCGNCKASKYFLCGVGTKLCEDVAALKAIPTADVVPVRHGHKVTHNRPIAGHWVRGELDGGWDGMEGRVWASPIENNPVDYCSECGKRLDDTFQKYCPNCGARMEGGGE